MNLLLLPGMDGTGKLFEPFLESLPSWLLPKVIAYPAREPLGYTELLPLVQAACPANADFVLLAESFSGPLAIMLAATQPPGLRGVVLSASFIRCPLAAPLRWLAASARPFYFRLAPIWPARRALVGRHGTDRVHRLFRAAMATVSPEVMAARARTMARVDVAAELGSCRIPLLYLAGRQDRVVGRRCLREIQEVKPDIKVVELPGPHLLLQTCAVEAASEIDRFVKLLV